MEQNNHLNWFSEFKKSEEYESFAKNPVAYFCAEYALESTLPTYAGGLGILAGDFVREASMQGFPLVSVGLCYQKAQSVLSRDKSFDKNKLKVVVDKNNEEIIVTLPIENRVVSVKARLWEEGETKVYLLDTDIPENNPEDRKITFQLYDENRDTRLKQEIVLGIGGFRLLASLGYHASVYHLNEGHSAFLALELVRHEMEHQHVSFEEACKYAKKHVLFTNHTLVSAGQEQFAGDKVSSFMETYAGQMGLSGETISALGTAASHPTLFSMTTLSFRLSTQSNAVSKLHRDKAEKVWPTHPMSNVTNGIFLKRWDKIGNISPRSIWNIHLDNKRKLLALVLEKTGEVWDEKDLIFVWARRLVEYKRPLLFLENVEKLVEISENSGVSIRVIFSGPTGENESLFVDKIKKIIEEKLIGTAIFIPNYSTDVAEILTAGGDVWLNTPLPGTEACGTSGMKAGLNGVLSLSTNDGWVYEVPPSLIGWVIDESKEEGKILSIIEKEIIPLYYNHLKTPANSLWTKKMERTRKLILEDFSTSRALREYIEKLYIPTLKQKHTHKIA